MVDVSVDGIKAIQKFAEQAVKSIEKQSDKAIDKTSKDLVKDAKRIAEHRDRTGDSRRSIKADVTKSGDTRNLFFYIDPSVGTVMMPSGYNRAWMLNDGTYEKYQRGAISPTAITVGARAGKTGLKHVDYMGKSWNKNIPKLEKKLEDIFIRLK